jgi:PilZ domain
MDASHLPSRDQSGESAASGPLRDRRAIPRATVELQARWRPHGSPEPPSLALLFDLSPRGARLAGWIPFDLSIGDEIDLLAEGSMVWRGRVVRSLGGGEYGVHFHDLSPEVKRRIIATVGRARAGQEGWADV